MTIEKDELEGVRAFIERDRAANGIGRGGWFSMKQDGEHEIRILKLAEFSTGTHWGVIEGENGKPQSIRCPKVFSGKPCPVCELVAELSASESQESQEKAAKLAAQVKYPMVIIDAESEDLEPKIYEAPKSVFYAVWDLIASKSGRYKDLLSLENGRNVILQRDSKKKRWVDYKIVPCPDRSSFDVDPKAVAELLETFKPASYEDIVYAMEHGQFPESRKDEPRQSKAAQPAKKYSQGLPAPKTRQEEPEEAEEEFEDIPEPPMPKAQTQAAPTRRVGLSAELKNKVAGLAKRS